MVKLMTFENFGKKKENISAKLQLQNTFKRF